MSDNAAVTQPDGSVRARIVQSTQQAVGPVLIGVMGAHAGPAPGSDGPQVPYARLEVLAHRELGIRSPGVVRLEAGQSIPLDGIGELVLVHVEEPVVGPAAVSSGSGNRAVVFLELRPH